MVTGATRSDSCASWLAPAQTAPEAPRPRPDHRRLRRRSFRHCYLFAGRGAIRLCALLDDAVLVSADGRRADGVGAARTHDGSGHRREPRTALSRLASAQLGCTTARCQHDQYRGRSRRHGRCPGARHRRAIVGLCGRLWCRLHPVADLVLGITALAAIFSQPRLLLQQSHC
jgi:hypothetical protein